MQNILFTGAVLTSWHEACDSIQKILLENTAYSIRKYLYEKG